MSSGKSAQRQSGGAGPLVVLAGLLAILLCGAIFLWSRDLRGGRQRPLYSIYRSDERGAAVAFRLFQHAGLNPKVWDRDLTRLTQPGMLLLLAPATSERDNERPFSFRPAGEFLPHEIEALDRWVRQGNVVVIMSRESNDLYAALGLIATEPKGISGVSATPAQPSVLARNVQSLRTHTQHGFRFGRRHTGLSPLLAGSADGADESGTGTDDEHDTKSAPEPPSPIPVIPAEEWVTLFAKENDQRAEPQVVLAARGRGLYVAVNDIFPATNVGITAEDNARFMLNLAALAPPGGTLWFDEYHKRNVERGFMAYLRDRSLLPPLVYGLLLALLLLWRANVRFGLPERRVADRRRDSREYLRAVATLYQTAHMGREALVTLYQDFRRRQGNALRADGLTDLPEIGRRYEARTGRPAAEAREILIEVEAALARPSLDDDAAVRLCGRLCELEQALAQPGSGSAPEVRQSRHLTTGPAAGRESR